MPRLFLPISLDRYASPISSLLREVAVRNSQWQIYSASSPDDAVSQATVEKLWQNPHLHRLALPSMILKRYDLAHVASATAKNRLLLRLAHWRSGGSMKMIYTANVEPFNEDANIEHYRKLILAANVVVSVSQCVRESVKRRWGRDSDAVIPNGADDSFFDPALVNIENVSSKPSFVYVGAIAPRKRADLVVQIAQRVPDADFLLAGGFPFPEYEQQCRALAAGLSNVHFLGPVNRPKLRELLAGAKGFIFPTEIEGLPLSVIEAQMMGLPVLGQPRTAMPELVYEGQNGYLIEGTDLATWESRIHELLHRSDNVAGSTWRQSIRAEAVRKFSWDEVARQYGELYGSLPIKS
jgi:alpha-maltose-1-phosphate synthase